MKKQLLGMAALLALATTAQAQRVYPLVNISDIQTVSPADLAACLDVPPASILGDTVRVQGIVLNAGGQAQSASGRQIWIRDINSQAGFNNLGIRFGGGNVPTTPNDLLNVVPGDTLEITGIVQEFNSSANDGETQINPLVDGVRNIGEGTGPAPLANLLADIGVLNDSQRLNNLPTGEQWEGAFIEVQNVTVVGVNAFSASGVARVSFTVRDAAGNQMEVSDRFLAQRFVTGFVAPNVGDQYTSLKGIIIHSKNRCQGSSGRGYTLNPFLETHYQRGASSPSIGSIMMNPSQPCSAAPTVIRAAITDDGSVASAKLIYTIGEVGTAVTVNMTVVAGDTFTATIPAQADGQFVKFFIRATDNLGNISNQPTTTSAPLFYISRCGAPSIRDIQYTPYTDGNSGYRGRVITGLAGIVTASSFDLGQVYIQQRGQNEWGGVWLSGGILADVQLGDSISVNGVVAENYNVTRVNVTDHTIFTHNNVVAPVVLDPSIVSTYDFTANEKYEGMLLKIALTGNSPLYIIDTNVAPAGSNYGQYRLGSSVFDPANGVIVQAGNSNGTNNFSSLNVSYVNNNRWATNLLVPNPVNISLLPAGAPFVSSVSGILYFGFNVLFLTPRVDADYAIIQATQPTLNANNKYVLAGNPATAGKSVTVLAKNSVNWKNISVSVVDAKGATQTLTQVAGDNAVTLNTVGLTAGLYTVRIINTTTGATEAQRLVIQ